MTDKNILEKTAPPSPLKNVTPIFPATPLSKLRSCQAPPPPPLFENLLEG